MARVSSWRCWFEASAAAPPPTIIAVSRSRANGLAGSAARGALVIVFEANDP